MQEVAFELEFLIVMDAVEDVCCHLQQIFNQLLICEIRGAVVDGTQYLRVSLECFILELFVSIDFVTLGLEDPTKSLRVHIVDVVFV
jgi:hypothetical protein